MRDVLNVEEAAEYLAFNPVTVRLKARSGEVPARKVGGEWRFSRRALLAWIEGSTRSGELEEAAANLLENLTDYYWNSNDLELEAVNRLRRLLGWREQLPKHLEAEVQAIEVEQAARWSKMGEK